MLIKLKKESPDGKVKYYYQVDKKNEKVWYYSTARGDCRWSLYTSYDYITGWFNRNKNRYIVIDSLPRDIPANPNFKDSIGLRLAGLL